MSVQVSTRLALTGGRMRHIGDVSGTEGRGWCPKMALPFWDTSPVPLSQNRPLPVWHTNPVPLYQTVRPLVMFLGSGADYAGVVCLIEYFGLSEAGFLHQASLGFGGEGCVNVIKLVIG